MLKLNSKFANFKFAAFAIAPIALFAGALTLAMGAAIWSASGSLAGTDPVKDPAKDLDIRAQMVRISRQMGVTCSHCHRLADLKDGTLESYKIAAAHMKLVDEVNAKRLRGLPKVDCYMCHQGKAHFSYKEIEATAK